MPDPVVIDSASAQEAMREAQDHPVRVTVPGAGEGFMVSDQTMRLIRKQLMRELADSLEESADKAEASGFKADELTEIIPDYAGD